MSRESTARRYHSVVRAEQAARTRRRILDAAARRFAEKGYAATTLGDIAAAAGVSVETVKASGAKRDLLLAALEQTFVGDEGSHSVTERDAVREIMAIADPAKFLRSAVGFIAAANARIAGLWPAFTSAANSDPAVYDALRQLDQRRHADYLHLVEAFVQRGRLPADADRDRIAQAWYYLLSPEGYQQLVQRSGWSTDAYIAWLIRTIERDLLD